VVTTLGDPAGSSGLAGFIVFLLVCEMQRDDHPGGLRVRPSHARAASASPKDLLLTYIGGRTGERVLNWVVTRATSRASAHTRSLSTGAPGRRDAHHHLRVCESKG
jgi:hypothetical protein